MRNALPSLAHASRRFGARVVLSGALAVGLLTSAPSLDVAAEAAPQRAQQQDQKPQRHRPKLTRVERAMNLAAAQKGDPYRYGASGPGAFDCSGLVFYSFRRAGFSNIPRTSSAQAHFAHRISRNNMRRGDLMFVHDGGGVYHVGVYAGFWHGRRQMLHAPYSGTRVRIDPVWTNSWFPGTLRR
jgi:cell wall-associated NlpC family hydrolase